MFITVTHNEMIHHEAEAHGQDIMAMLCQCSVKKQKQLE